MRCDSLKHYGVLGMKWGVRRYQNKDGSLTEAGKKRYHIDAEGKSTGLGAQTYYKESKNLRNQIINDDVEFGKQYNSTEGAKKYVDQMRKANDKFYELLDKNDGEDSPDSDKASIELSRLEKQHRVEQGKYAVKQLINKYGDDLINVYSNFGVYNSVKTATELYLRRFG